MKKNITRSTTVNSHPSGKWIIEVVVTEDEAGVATVGQVRVAHHGSGAGQHCRHLRVRDRDEQHEDPADDPRDDRSRPGQLVGGDGGEEPARADDGAEGEEQ